MAEWTTELSPWCHSRWQPTVSKNVLANVLNQTGAPVSLASFNETELTSWFRLAYLKELRSQKLNSHPRHSEPVDPGFAVLTMQRMTSKGSHEKLANLRWGREAAPYEGGDSKVRPPFRPRN